MNSQEKFDASKWNSIDEGITQNSFSKRIEGPTPNGAYAVEYFYDEEGNPCTEENASKVHIHEFDENNNFVFETIGYLNSSTISQNINKATDKFNPSNWGTEFDEREVVGFKIEYFDFQLIKYDRGKRKLLFTLDDNNKQYIENFTKYGINIYTSGNKVDLSNSMNIELLHILQGNIEEPVIEKYDLVNPMKVSVWYSDNSKITSSTELKENSKNRKIHQGNKFLYDLDSFLRSNFQKDMWEIDYDVEYTCPKCKSSFRKSYSDFIFHDDEPIVCPNCNYDLIGETVEYKQKTKIDNELNSSNLDSEELQKSLKSRKGACIAFMIISLVIVVFFVIVGLPQGCVGGLVFFFFFLILTVKTNNKLEKLNNEKVYNKK